MNPFENEQWIRNMIATGAITPPRGDMPRLQDAGQQYVLLVRDTGDAAWLLGASSRVGSCGVSSAPPPPVP